MFKIWYSETEWLDSLFFYPQYIQWMRLIDRVARGIASERDIFLIRRKLERPWFHGANHVYANLIYRTRLFYGKNWNKYSAIYNIVYLLYRENCTHYAHWYTHIGYTLVNLIAFGDGTKYTLDELQGIDLTPHFDPLLLSLYNTLNEFEINDYV